MVKPAINVRIRMLFLPYVLFMLAFLTPVQLLAGPEDPWDGGQWSAVIDWPHIAVSAANLPDGRVLTWSGSERETWPTTEQTYSATWDPSTGAFEEIFHPTHNMFCAHLAMLEDGRVFVNGGRNQTNSPWTSVFDFRDSEWVQIENMPSGGRWYPTTIATAEGDVFTAIGTASQQRYPEIWNVQDGWQIKNGIDFNAMVLNDYFSSGSHGESRWWPILHVAPNGQIFHSGPTPKMHYIDVAGNGSYTQTGPEFTDWYHKHGTSIMYDEGKILTAGGWIAGNNITSTNKAFTIDLNGPSPVVQLTAPMEFARKFHNGVMLPNGEVLVVGGNTSGQKFSDNGTVLATEIWNPQTGQWRRGASMATPRNYHSVALLLVDGRVLAAGSGYCAGNANCNGSSHKDAEVYSPSYLFDANGNLAARPSITGAPGRVSSGEVFDVSATQGITQFSMIKMSSTTHGMNTDVRFVNVSFTEVAPGSYELVANTNTNVLTAGYWMLFAIDGSGVPSVAHVMQANTSGMPWINQLPDQSSGIDQSVDVQITAGDADDDPLTYSAIGLPEGLSIDPATGAITGAATSVGNYAVTVTVNDNDEGSRSRSFDWAVFGQGLGQIRRDWWTGISGTAVSDLTNNPNYPDSPTGTEFITSLETPTNIDNNYGTRVHGYLTPDVSGDYRFWIASDDFGELWLSSDGDPANKARIAHVPGWSPSRNWTKYPEQESPPVSLVAGQTYFIEALQKEAGGGDNLAVGWRKPGESGISVIPGAYLSTDNIGIGSPADAKIHAAIAQNVGDAWSVISLPENYDNMVVVATPVYTDASVPLVTRIRNASGNQFELRVQNPSGASSAASVPVHYVVAEVGVYSGNGITMEVAKYESSVVDRKNSWVGETLSYGQSYTNPLVIGQVMSANDAQWSVFWASSGSRTNPPSASAFSAGRHVGEDSSPNRADETIGYFVFEAGGGQVGPISLRAALGGDVIRGVGNNAPYSYTLGDTTNVAILSSNGMDGGDGGWPVLYGGDPLSGGVLQLAIDEDRINDTERSHTTEQVAYLALDVPLDEPLTVNPIDPVPETVGNAVAFDASASGGTGLLYNWNFGDGSPETGFTVQSQVAHSYTAPGRYIVSVTVRDPMSGEEVIQTFVQLVHYPLAAFVPSASTSIVLHENQRQSWNVNPDNDTVTVIDTISRTKLSEITVGDEPVAVQVAPDGTVWVVNKSSASISVIDSVALAVTSTISLQPASQPHGLVFHGGLGAAYVALEATGDVLKLDADTGAELARAFVGNRPRHVSIGGDGLRLFVSRFVTPVLPDEWTASPVVESGGVFYGGEVVSIAADTMVQTDVTVLQHSDRGVSEHTGPGVPNYLGPAVMSPDATAAFVPSKQDNILAGALRGGQGMTFDQTVRAVTSKIDLPAAKEAFWARIDHDNASVASHAAFGPYGAYLFTALEGNREIAISDAYTAVELMRFDTARAPQGLAVSADGQALYVHNFMDRSVTIFDISAVTGSNKLEVTLLATVDAVANEQLSAQVLNGKQLFYDARDPRLALDSYMSCASCHNQGGQDGRVWDFTGVGEGLRNTITLEGRAATVHGFLHWSANFDEVQDFEGQIRNFAGGTGLMSDADFLAGTRSEPLGDPKAGLSSDLDALAAYLGSLDAFPDSPYRNADGTLSADAELGRLVFEDKGCAGCHAPPRFTDSDAANLHDVGTLEPSSGLRLGGPLNGIDTPSLISVWKTAPYLHDGSAFDTTEAIAAHVGLTLTQTELTQLGFYLEELDGVTASIGFGCVDCFDFSSLTIDSYSNQDRVGTYSIVENGAGIYLQDNTWKRTIETYAITPNTVIEFEFESSSQGEIHGIGFDENNSLSSSRIFQVYGTQNWGIGAFDTYSGSGRVTMQIPVGQYYTGNSMHLIVVNDKDSGSQGNNSTFRNVRVFESP